MLKNKKLGLLVLVILAIVIFFIVYFIVINSNKTETEQSGEAQADVNAGETYELDLESTSDKPIELEEVEAKNLHIEAMGNQVATTVTIINNSSEPIDELDIEIELLDDKQNTITIISNNIREKIENGQSMEFSSYATIDKIAKVADAKITRIEKLGTDKEKIE